MFDELDRLRVCNELSRLLSHYASLPAADATVWHDRLMALDGVAASELVKLHGELLAYDWIELNVGVTTGKTAGSVECCYRVTTAGRRVLKRALVREDEEVGLRLVES